MRRNGSLITKVDIVDEVIASMQALDASQALVGIPADTAGRSDGPINSAAIGYILETGDPAQNLPARPFLVPTIWRIRSDLAKRARKTIDAVTSGKPGAEQRVSQGLNALGLLASQAVRRTIDAGDFAPLAPSTIYRRQNRRVAPRSGEHPLIDTGQLRSSITYVIRKR